MGVIAAIIYVIIALMIVGFISIILSGGFNGSLGSNTFSYSGKITFADPYTEGGGFLVGASQKELLTIHLSNGIDLNQTLDCNFYSSGMNVTVQETINYLPRTSNESAVGTTLVSTPPGNVFATTTEFYTVTFYAEAISYSIVNLPQGC